MEKMTGKRPSEVEVRVRLPSKENSDNQTNNRSLIMWIFFLKKLIGLQGKKTGARKMAQQLKALAALPENPDSIPSTHVAVYNCL